MEDDFLGDLAQLVNLDALSIPAQQQPKSTFGPSPTNPFGNTAQKSNPFEAGKPPAPTLNQLAVAGQPPAMQSRELFGYYAEEIGGGGGGGGGGAGVFCFGMIIVALGTWNFTILAC